MRIFCYRIRRSTALLLVVLGTAAVLYVRYARQEAALDETDPDPDVVRVIRWVDCGSRALGGLRRRLEKYCRTLLGVLLVSSPLAAKETCLSW